MISGLRFLADTGRLRLVRVVVSVAVLASALPLAARSVSDTLDRAKGERTITYIADGSTDPTQPVFTFNASSAGDGQTSAISLAFVSAGEGSATPRPRFAGCHEVEWFADGQALTAGAVVYGGQIIDGEMVEWLDQEVSPQWAAALGSARAAHYRVCRNQYLLSPGDIQAFALISNKLKNAALVSGVVQGRPPTQAPVQKVDYQGMNWRPRNP